MCTRRLEINGFRRSIHNYCALKPPQKQVYPSGAYIEVVCILNFRHLIAHRMVFGTMFSISNARRILIYTVHKRMFENLCYTLLGPGPVRKLFTNVKTTYIQELKWMLAWPRRLSQTCMMCLHLPKSLLFQSIFKRNTIIKAFALNYIFNGFYMKNSSNFTKRCLTLDLQCEQFHLKIAPSHYQSIKKHL